MSDPIPIWAPQPGPQAALLQCPIRDVFYGGARGGGKTDGLLGDFLSHAGRHGSYARGAFFRKTIPELDEVIERSHEIYRPLGWSYNHTKHTWRPPTGGFLRMRYLEQASDADNYQGHSYSWLGFDELPNWPDPKPIDKLWGTLRSAHGVPCVRRSTGNPGGPGHVWVKKRYRIEHPMRPFFYEPIPDYRDPKTGLPLTIEAVFIPSRLEDNPKLMEKDPMYESGLAAVGNLELFKAWRYGNWDILAGQYFDIWDERIHTVEAGEANPPGWANCWISADWGFSDETVILWHWIDENNRTYTYRELVFNKKTPEEIGREILAATPKTEKIAMLALSPDAFQQRTSPRTIALEIGEVLRDTHIPAPNKADDDRIGGWQLMYQMLKTGHWKISKACPVLIESLPLMIRKETNPNDIEDSTVDHAPDAARYGLKTYVRESRQAIAELTRKKIMEIPDETSRNLAWMQEKEKHRWKHMNWQRPKRYIG